jgi:hypothetical protein
MLRKLFGHLSGNAVAYLALFVALGGTSVAAVSLKNGSVKGKHISRNAVSSPKVKDRSLLARDFAAGQLPRGKPGQPGQPGQNGAPGQDGQTGPRGPSNAYANLFNATGVIQLDGSEVTLGQLTLPAGSYAFTASAEVTTSAPSTNCRIKNQGTVVATSSTVGDGDALTLSGVASNSGGPATFTCQASNSSGMSYGNTTFRAVQVETLTMQTP